MYAAKNISQNIENIIYNLVLYLLHTITNLSVRRITFNLVIRLYLYVRLYYIVFLISIFVSMI